MSQLKPCYAMVLNTAQHRKMASRMSRNARLILIRLIAIITALVLVCCCWASVSYGSSSGSSQSRGRMVRLCIASVDPNKLSSQCVMCNRREFPLTVIDCTGFSKMNDLIANPLSVQDATCLVYNCRREANLNHKQQVPDIRPEPYHGTAAVRANYPSASGIRSYEILPPVSNGYPQHYHHNQHPHSAASPLMGPHQSTATITRYHTLAYAHPSALHYTPTAAGYVSPAASSAGRHLQLPYGPLLGAGLYAPPGRFSHYDY